MPLPAAILSQLRDTVTVTLGGAADAYNEIAPGAALTARARITYAREGRADTSGDEHATSLVIHMEDVAGFTGDARLTLPDGKTYPVKSYVRPAWPDGTRHLRVVV